MDRPTLLLIEDDPVLQTVLIDIFSGAGYDVRAAINAEDALVLAAWSPPTVAILCGDSRGTFNSGWQAAYLLRTSYPHLPLVMLTTNPAALRELGKTERGRWFTAGMLKPFQLNELLTTVAQACSTSVAVEVAS